MTLEELLNKLIEKGWNPRGEDKIHSCRYYEEEKKFKADYTIAGIPQVLYRSIRELCSREAGLRQFVCENGMVKGKGYCNGWVYHDEYDDYNDGNGEYNEKNRPRYYDDNFQYRLIESSLKDESELEEFLLQNIKVDEKDNM